MNLGNLNVVAVELSLRPSNESKNATVGDQGISAVEAEPDKDAIRSHYESSWH